MPKGDQSLSDRPIWYGQRETRRGLFIDDSGGGLSDGAPPPVMGAEGLILSDDNEFMIWKRMRVIAIYLFCVAIGEEVVNIITNCTSQAPVLKSARFHPNLDGPRGYAQVLCHFAFSR